MSPVWIGLSVVAVVIAIVFFLRLWADASETAERTRRDAEEAGW